MTKIVKMPVVEWQLGRLELGRVSGPSQWGDKEWCLLDPADLHWFGFNQESCPVRSFAGASNPIFDGRQAIAQVIRPSKKQLPPSVTCFVEFPTHYLTNAYDEGECRDVLDSAPHALDPSKPVLCGGFPDGSITVLPVHPTDPVWIGAVYRLRTEAQIDPAADLRDPATRARVRSMLAANQAVRDRFVLDPAKYREDATCYALVSADGETSLSIDGCTFTGLVATPSAEVSARLLREMDVEEDEEDPSGPSSGPGIGEALI
jgi:hypothetical protein